MTTITPLTVLTPRQLRLRDARAAVATLAMVASLTFLWRTATVEAAPEPDERMERILRAACRLPDTDGAVTIFTRIDGKSICWRLR